MGDLQADFVLHDVEAGGREYGSEQALPMCSKGKAFAKFAIQNVVSDRNACKPRGPKRGYMPREKWRLSRRFFYSDV